MLQASCNVTEIVQGKAFRGGSFNSTFVVVESRDLLIVNLLLGKNATELTMSLEKTVRYKEAAGHSGR